MEGSKLSGNPFIKGLLLSLAATAAVFVGLLFMRQIPGIEQWLYRFVSIGALGICAAKLAENGINLFLYRKCLQQNGGKRLSREEFLAEQRASSINMNQGLKMGITALILFSLLTLQSVFGNATGTESLKHVSMEDLSGRYEVTDIKGDDQASMAYKLVNGMGMKMYMEIDMDGYAAYGISEPTTVMYRFYPDKMIYVAIEEGKETDRGGTFTLNSGKLVLNNRMYLEKISGDTDS